MERRGDFFSKFCPPPVLWEPFKVLERLLVIKLPVRQPIDKCALVFVPPLAIGKFKEIKAFCKQHCAMASAGKTVFAQFTKARSIHRDIF